MKPRRITEHEVNGLNEAIKIKVLDAPGPGGANHCYHMKVRAGDDPGDPICKEVELDFQNGPIQEAGYNGISNEALLAVLIDRMRGFQYERNEDGSFDDGRPGKFACMENARALSALEAALIFLKERTRKRIDRGVEGTHEK